MNIVPVFVGLDYHQDSVQVCVLDSQGKQLCKAPAKKGAARTKAAAKKPPAKASEAKKPKAAPKGKRRLSGLDAAAKLLAETKQPMNCRELVEAMATKGYWKSPGGKTPHATLYSAILREIKAKGKNARFRKTERGQFALT